MKKMLLSIDGSECSYRAVEYTGKQFSGMQDLYITLLHVLPYPPAPLWDDGHIPTKEEKEEREKAIERWLADQRTKAEPVFEKAVAILTNAGIAPTQLARKMISDSTDVAGSILEEARDGGYQTLVLGRHGLHSMKQVFMGGITTKIVNHGAGVTICVVE